MYKRFNIISILLFSILITACGGGGSSSSTTTENTTPLADSTAPFVTSLSPSDDSSNIAVSSNLILTFSENIQKGSGDIYIGHTSDNTLFATINIANTSVSGNSLIINPPNDFTNSTGYYVLMDGNLVTDSSGNRFAGINTADAWNFTTAASTTTPSSTTPPVATSFSPADNSSDVTLSSNLIISFNEPIQKGLGNISIRRSSDNALFTTINVADTTLSGTSLIINPLNNFTYSTEYYVLIDSGVVTDSYGNSFAGITSTTTWNFTTIANTTLSDTSAPQPISFSPADNSSNNNGSAQLVLSFNEAIQQGSGNVYIKNSSTNANFATINITNTIISGNSITINPPENFVNNTGYYVTIDSGAITDLSGNAYSGISSSSLWNFTINDDFGNNFETATLYDGLISTYTASTSIAGSFDNSGDIDFLKFHIKSSGTLQFTGMSKVGRSSISSYSFAFYDQEKSVVEIYNNTIDVVPGTYYFKVMEANGATGSYSLSFQFTKTASDNTPPTIYNLIPRNNDTYIYPNNDIKILFSENVSAGFGYIKIYNESGQLLENISASNTAIEDNIVSINHTTTFSRGSKYYILVDNRAFKDLSGNYFTGVTNSNGWSFETLPYGYDNDLDYIADEVESLVGLSSANIDENGNGVPDGLDTDGIHGDKFANYQWHLRSLGNVVNDNGFASIYGNDLGITELYSKYMGYNRGNNIIVQVVDDGVDAYHEDLMSNMDITRSYYGDLPTQGDPSPDSPSDTHGTEVAGIIGARAFNGKGVKGIAPFVKIAGSNFLSHQNVNTLDAVWYSGYGANDISITNNSWGNYYSTNTAFEQYLQLGTSSLRSGKGRIYTFAAGNTRYENGDSNLNYMINNRYGVVVAALKHDNKYASYSNPGSNLLISGYGGDYSGNSPTIGTTTVTGQGVPGVNGTTWAEDTAGNYSYAMNGTSAATPNVSGSLALVLEACPSLTWRDVKYLIATTGIQVDSSNTTWIQNSAGLWHSTDYGYGLINPKGIINECTDGYTNLPSEKSFEITSNYGSNNYIDDGYATTFNIDSSSQTTINNIEWVEVTIDSDHSDASDLKIELISPSGTKTQLLHAGVDTTLIGKTNFLKGGHRFGSAAFYDESGNGNWTVKISDLAIANTGVVTSIKLKVYGH